MLGRELLIDKYRNYKVKFRGTENVKIHSIHFYLQLSQARFRFFLILFPNGEQPPYLKGERLPSVVLQFANAVSLKLIDHLTVCG